MKPLLGTFTDPPGPARIDLPRLLETKLLLQAGSGFGKSWALRRILEQTHDGCQQFVIDPEGEFATLRERHGYVLAAVNGGDVVAHPRTAVAAAAGYGHLQSTGFVKAMGKLRTLGFVDYPDRGTVVAKPVLFLE